MTAIEGRLYNHTVKVLEIYQNEIYGRLWLPENTRADEKPPLVIMSHGLGDNHAYDKEGFAFLAENGIAVFSFDFKSGSAVINENKSGPAYPGMSVVTEAGDLAEVINMAADWDFTDNRRIALMGYSQGGFVTALAAAELPEELRSHIKCLLLLYPGFSLADMVKSMFGAPENIPDSFGLFDDFITVKRNYAADIWDIPIYEVIKAFTGPVLIIHGDSDLKVPLSYSERAAEAYENCRLTVIKNQEHGFGICRTPEIQNEILNFLREQLLG